MSSEIRVIKCLALIGLCCIALFIPETVYAEKAPKILVLNSDASVEKYKEPQKEFNKTISYPVKDIDLGDKKWKASDVEELIYDEDPELIYCIGTKAYLIANKYAEKKAIVFSSIINWRRLPLTEKTYGVSNEFRAGMEMMWFRYIFPDVKKIGVLYSKKYTKEWFKNTKNEAKEISFEIIGREVSKKKPAISELTKLLPKVDAFWLISDPELMSDKKDLLEILKQCDTEKIPIFSYHTAFAKFGAVLAVSADNATIGRQAASIATEVLSGTEIDDKVQFPAGSYIILNLCKVRQYGLEYNEDALDSVNSIIDCNERAENTILRAGRE